MNIINPVSEYLNQTLILTTWNISTSQPARLPYVFYCLNVKVIWKIKLRQSQVASPKQNW